MLREIVRAFFAKLAQLENAAERKYRRSDLVVSVLAWAVESGVENPSPSGMTSAVDAELGHQAQRPEYSVHRLERGIYRFLPSRDIFESGMPPISPEVLEKLILPEFRRLPVRAARSFFAGDLGAMDARTLVATDLLKLRDEEFDSLFALQELAL
jgi:hypothetical protein